MICSQMVQRSADVCESEERGLHVAEGMGWRDRSTDTVSRTTSVPASPGVHAHMRSDREVRDLSRQLVRETDESRE